MNGALDKLIIYQEFFDFLAQNEDKRQQKTALILATGKNLILHMQDFAIDAFLMTII